MILLAHKLIDSISLLLLSQIAFLVLLNVSFVLLARLIEQGASHVVPAVLLNLSLLVLFARPFAFLIDQEISHAVRELHRIASVMPRTHFDWLIFYRLLL
jgi:hypothetical protein